MRRNRPMKEQTPHVEQRFAAHGEPLGGRSSQCDIHVAQPSIPQERAGEFKDTQIVARLLFVSHQNSTPSIEPAQGALDHPTSWLPLVLLSSFLFDRADVPTVVVLLDGGMACRVVIALIQADVLFVLGLRRALDDT